MKNEEQKNARSAIQARAANFAFWIVASWLFVQADQYTKRLAVLHLKGQKAIVVWEGVFELFYSENKGAAFGILQGQQGFFFITGILVMAAAMYMIWQMPPWKDRHYHGLRLCIVLITAGALGNMADRVSQGYVVDFLYFKLIDFPIFNVADIYVTTVTAILILLMLFFYSESDMEIFRLRGGRQS